jgi:hypothetical protein
LLLLLLLLSLRRLELLLQLSVLQLLEKRTRIGSNGQLDRLLLLLLLLGHGLLITLRLCLHVW